MKLLMIATDGNMFDAQSAVFHRTLEYASHCETLTVIISGTGTPRESSVGNLRIIAPGGRSKVMNFFRMLYTARLIGGSVVTAQDPFYTGLIGVLSLVRPLQIQMHTTQFGLVGSVLARFTLMFASCVRVVSEDVKRRVQPLTRAPVFVLSIYVDTAALLTPMSRPQEFGQHPIVLTVSRLAPEKRVDRVIRAMGRVPDAHLYIVGDGPLRKTLEHLADEQGLSARVHFLGWKHDVAAYYQHADCFVQLSAFEGYGLSLMEAVIAGAPAISTDVGVAHELAPELVTKIRGDEYSLSGAITETLSHKTREHGRDAREVLVRSLPTRETYVERYMHYLLTCGVSDS